MHRLLNCLCEVGFVVQNKETRRFSLGSKIVDLGSVKENNTIRNNALPFLIELSKQMKENVYLSIIEGNEGVVLDCLNATKPIYHFNSEIKGIRLPLSVDAPNKVLLANSNLNTRDRIVSDLLKQKLIDDRKELESELRIIKQYGYIQIQLTYFTFRKYSKMPNLSRVWHFYYLLKYTFYLLMQLFLFFNFSTCNVFLLKIYISSYNSISDSFI